MSENIPNEPTKIVYLSPKERVKARVIGEKVWALGMKELHGQDVRIVGNDDSGREIIIYGENTFRGKEATDEKNVDFCIVRQKQKNDRETAGIYADTYLFYRDKGGYILNINTSKEEGTKRHEAGETELKKLLESFQESIVNKLNKNNF